MEGLSASGAMMCKAAPTFGSSSSCSSRFMVHSGLAPQRGSRKQCSSNRARRTASMSATTLSFISASPHTVDNPRRSHRFFALHGRCLSAAVPDACPEASGQAASSQPPTALSDRLQPLLHRDLNPANAKRGLEASLAAAQPQHHTVGILQRDGVRAGGNGEACARGRVGCQRCPARSAGWRQYPPSLPTPRR